MAALWFAIKSHAPYGWYLPTGAYPAPAASVRKCIPSLLSNKIYAIRRMAPCMVTSRYRLGHSRKPDFEGEILISLTAVLCFGRGQ